MSVLFPAHLHRKPSMRAWRSGALAGLAGGAAEVIWIGFYGHLTGGDPALVARGVAQSFFSGWSAGSLAVSLGIAIHMTLAIVLGMAIAVLLRSILPRLSGSAFEPVTVVGLLIAVWAINFFLVLPVVNPAFIDLVPCGAGLTSKVLFGAAAAFVLQIRHQSSPATGLA